MQQKNTFRHESLQDADTIQQLLKSLAKGLANGQLTFSDEEGEIALQPEGLLNLKVTATKDAGRQKLSLRVTWQTQDEVKSSKKSLQVTTAKGKR